LTLLIGPGDQIDHLSLSRWLILGFGVLDLVLGDQCAD
jgi:hypothetical protein